MMRKSGLVALLVVLCCGAAHVHGQGFPPGLFDDVLAVANMPGAVSSFSGAVSGQAPVTRTYGTGNGGSAMASATSTSNGKTMTSTTVNGVTKTSVNAANTNYCAAISSYNGQACDGPSGRCCAVTANIKRCKTFVSGQASINAVKGRCCITLLRAKDKSPALFCAGPASKAYYSLPTNAEITIRPSCQTYKEGPGSMACLVKLPSLLPGFIVPRGYTAKKPLIYNKAQGFIPCMHPAFNRVLQVDNVRDNQLIITSKCE